MIGELRNIPETLENSGMAGVYIMYIYIFRKENLITITKRRKKKSNSTKWRDPRRSPKAFWDQDIFREHDG
jgi:hypothetical protein